MRSTQSLYRYAKKKNIEIIRYSLPETGSMSISSDTGHCYIGMDESAFETSAEERTHLAHELGHCVTGSFYNRYTAVDCRQRHENRADKWAIRKIISATELDDAVTKGITELWELADYFDVTESFMRKALCLFTHGNLETELYFKTGGDFV